MKTRNRTTTLMIVLVMVFAMAATLSAQTSTQGFSILNNNESENSLEGVWQTEVTFRDCHTGVVFGSFKGLRTIASGGTLMETNPSFPTTGHGIWRRTGERRYSVNVMFYSYDATGNFGGNAKIAESIRLSRDANSYTSTSTFQFVDPSGIVVDSGCSTETATRAAF